jgi:hypothetical protein
LTGKTNFVFLRPLRFAAPVLAAFFLCCLLQGCRATGGAAAGDAPETALAEMSAPAPAGTRLGYPYVSALGEQCREAYPESGPSGGAGVYCLRNGKWELLPDIYMSVPAAESNRQP